tara:strand:- start:452 stop:844 length:393 start_codon:yes stop_codon:yes gene_type:complete
MIETYQELKIRQQNELNAFEHIFFAFSNKQFEEGLKRLDTGTKGIFSLGGGGYVLKSHAKDLDALFTRHQQELKEHRKNRKNLLEALVYELRNHEFCITCNVTDALEALGLALADIPKDILNKAKKLALI